VSTIFGIILDRLKCMQCPWVLQWNQCQLFMGLFDVIQVILLQVDGDHTEDDLPEVADF
jgi:hypothetical protein